MSLTRRGRLLLVSVAGAAAAGAVFGIAELVLLAVAGAVVLVGAVVSVLAVRWDVGSERSIRPHRVATGTSPTVELVLTNRRRRRSPVVEITDALGPSGPATVFHAAPLAPGERLVSSYTIPQLRRGRYQLGPLRLAVRDPFDVVRISRTGAPSVTLTVHPRIGARRARSDRFASAPASAHEAGGRGPWGGDLDSLRTYQPGDDLRAVHWPSTARMDRVMVRQPDASAPRHHTVAVDLRARSWPAGDIEDVLAAAAALLEAARRSGDHIRLITSSGTDTNFGASGEHWGRILDALADARAGTDDEGTTLAVQLRSPRVRTVRSGQLTVLTSAALDADDLASLRALAPPSQTTVTVVSAEHPRRA